MPRPDSGTGTHPANPAAGREGRRPLLAPRRSASDEFLPSEKQACDAAVQITQIQDHYK